MHLFPFYFQCLNIALINSLHICAIATLFEQSCHRSEIDTSACECLTDWISQDQLMWVFEAAFVWRERSMLWKIMCHFTEATWERWDQRKRSIVLPVCEVVAWETFVSAWFIVFILNTRVVLRITAFCCKRCGIFLAT